MPAIKIAPWPVVEAKSRLSELIDIARFEGPQTITRNGRPVAMLVSYDEWRRQTAPEGTLFEFFVNSPLRGLDLEMPRLDDGPRELDL